MVFTEQNLERGLNQETLKRVSGLSKLKKPSKLSYRVVAKSVGPYTDEIKVEYPNGTVKTEYIEEA